MILVDSNVLIDLLQEDQQWAEWAAEQIAKWGSREILAINMMVYSEVSLCFDTIEELDVALAPEDFRRLPVPWEAGFLAGRCFLNYRRRGGARRSPLPDFYIGAHAAVEGLTVLTRDPSRFQTYFPTVPLIAPA